MERPSWTRVAVGVLAAAIVPFFVTGFYRVIDISSAVELLLPFVILGVLALGLWRSWRNVAIGIISGALIYGAFLTLLLYTL